MFHLSVEAVRLEGVPLRRGVCEVFDIVFFQNLSGFVFVEMVHYEVLSDILSFCEFDPVTAARMRSRIFPQIVNLILNYP